jgi:predicted ATPase/DNA-binding SARP family transcriptional activator
MQFRILGPLEVEDAGRLLRPTGAKQRVLLASLLLHANQTVSRGRLIDELWGERAPQTAAHRLEDHVSRLRKLLRRNGETPVVTRPAGYLLRVSQDALDVSQFEHLVREGTGALRRAHPEGAVALLRQALALWRGPPLEDVADDGIAWPEVRQLEELRAVAHEQLMEAELARGRHAEVVDELGELVRREPLRERLRFLLMLALYRSGRQADALASYREARRAMAAELGLEPGRELKDLEQAILRQDPSLELFEPGGRPLPAVPRAPAGNLPRPMTSLVGRRREIDDVLALLAAGSRLIALTGPGGSGKTRLALEAAYRASPDFPDGVFWVGLAALRDPSLVLDAIAQILGAPDGAAAHIGDRRVLLLVDNFEQVNVAGPELAALARECPKLHLLVTSRELLRLNAETEYEVLPLADSEAIELFCVRGHAQPEDSVAELCRRLDNLPLAIEFAAARTAVLSPRQILERISQRLDLLKGGRDAESRQRTLRATLEWSHDLLTAEERRLFARLSVYAGGWTFESAEEVADADLDTLQSLVEKSLVQHDGERFAMLETTREFALEGLQASGESDDVRRRHATYFTEFAERVAPELQGADAAHWNAVLTAELDNLRGALSFADHAGECSTLVRLGGALGRLFWAESAHRDEGRVWIERALATGDGPPEARTQALLGLAIIAELEGDTEGGRRHAKEMLALAREHDDAEGVFFALINLGVLSDELGESEALFEESARVAREEGGRFVRVSSDEALALIAVNLGCRRLLAGSYEEAFTLSQQGAARLHGIPMARVKALTNAGSAARELGRLNDAAEWLGQGLSLATELGVTVVHEVGGLAALELARGRLTPAARLTGAAEALCDQGFLFESFERAIQERTIAALANVLDRDTLTTALEEGRALPFDEAVAYALESATL